MKTVITYGTFDIFHVGHLNILNRARALGDRLVVGVSSDEFNLEKGKKCVFPYSERAAIVESIKGVDSVFAETRWDQKEADIRSHRANVLVMGDDWKGKFDHLRELCDVIYLPRTPSVSTTEVKDLLRGVSKEQLDAMRGALEFVSTIVRDLS